MKARMRVGLRGVVLALLLAVASQDSLADDTDPDFARLANQATSDAKVVKPQEQLVAENLKLAKERLEIQALYQRKYSEHQAWVLEYTRYVYYWHFFSTVVVFFLVGGIVVFGLRLSYLQFRKDFLTRERKSAAPGLVPLPAAGGESGTAAAPDQQTSVHSLKLGLQGLEISSSVIGLLILALSLGFFYLYLDQVYPIKQQGPGAQTVRPQEGTSTN